MPHELFGRTLRGGSEAAAVTLITARHRDDRGRRRLFRCVSKTLVGRPMREAEAYECLTAVYANGFSPQLLGVDRSAPNSATIYLEAINQPCAWPWQHLPVARALLERLAAFHVAAAGNTTALPAWDYETDLRVSAEATLEGVDSCRHDPDLEVLGRELMPVSRIVHALPKLRRQLLEDASFGTGAIHGDVHTGNALFPDAVCLFSSTGAVCV